MAGSTPRKHAPLTIRPPAREQLERRVRASTTPQRVVRRSQIVLLAAEGMTPSQIAARLGTSRQTVTRWLGRFVEGGEMALARDAAGRGRKSSVTAAAVFAAMRIGDGSRPPTIRDVAKRLGTSATAVHRVLHIDSGTTQKRNKRRQR